MSAIVDDYVRLAEPVGSRALSKHVEIHLSAATIRNEMADLEEMGLLDQPHTSAGRVPSQKGYRFYVDNLMDKRGIDVQTADTLRQLFMARMTELERIIQQTATVLSELTNYTSIVLGPKLATSGAIKHVQLVPLTGGKAVAILVTDTGHVENKQVQLSDDVTADNVVEMVNLLNAKLVGVPLSKMKSHLFREIAEEMAKTLEHYEDALAVLNELCTPDSGGEERVYIGGATNILAQPEFKDVEKVRPLLELLEQTDAVQQVVPVASMGLQIRIGQENQFPMLQDCAVVSATYFIGARPVGSVGLLGPTRMNYARVTQILDYVSNSLTRVMTDRTNSS